MHVAWPSGSGSTRNWLCTTTWLCTRTWLCTFRRYRKSSSVVISRLASGLSGASYTRPCRHKSRRDWAPGSSRTALDSRAAAVGCMVSQPAVRVRVVAVATLTLRCVLPVRFLENTTTSPAQASNQRTVFLIKTKTKTKTKWCMLTRAIFPVTTGGSASRRRTPLNGKPSKVGVGGQPLNTKANLSHRSTTPIENGAVVWRAWSSESHVNMAACKLGILCRSCCSRASVQRSLSSSQGTS
jgi:hypothetical protein